MELTPIERLKMHLELNHPGVKIHHVHLSPNPGFILAARKSRVRGKEDKTVYDSIDIRGVGYPRRTAKLKLWKELHAYFTTHVEVIKLRHNVLPTKIVWQGRTYILDQRSTFQNSKKEKKHGKEN